MSSFKKIVVGIATITIAVVMSVLSQKYQPTHAASTLPGSNEVISLATTDGLPTNADTKIYAGGLGTVISSNANVLLVSSKATNLTNSGGSKYTAYGGLYAHNIRANTTTRVDISASGVLPDGQPGAALLSENGRYVYFLSYATNLIDGKTQYAAQTYIRDLQTGIIKAISNNYWSGLSQDQDMPLGISNDGRFAFLGTRYVGVSYPNFYNAMLGDSKTGSFTWTSTGVANSNTGEIKGGGLSCDGSLAVYQQDNGYIYLVDSRNGTPVATLISGAQSSFPKISCNGTYITYSTFNRTDVSPTPSGAGAYIHVVLFNRITGERKYIDTDSTGAFDSSHNTAALTIADTGDATIRYNGYAYIKHLSDGSGTLEAVGKTVTGSYINTIGTGQLSSDGRFVFFHADPYDLGLALSPSSSQIIRAKTGL